MVKNGGGISNNFLSIGEGFLFRLMGGTYNFKWLYLVFILNTLCHATLTPVLFAHCVSSNTYICWEYIINYSCLWWRVRVMHFPAVTQEGLRKNIGSFRKGQDKNRKISILAIAMLLFFEARSDTIVDQGVDLTEKPGMLSVPGSPGTIS